MDLIKTESNQKKRKNKFIKFLLRIFEGQGFTERMGTIHQFCIIVKKKICH